ncbi:MAG: hypothetical protein KatS3mg034_2167 [Vicingaceae bacterium]|nr:MAG: hypothetical protein KatS3mg034_2167 [Vicingaceae bacterium]
MPAFQSTCRINEANLLEILVDMNQMPSNGYYFLKINIYRDGRMVGTIVSQTFIPPAAFWYPSNYHHLLQPLEFTFHDQDFREEYLRNGGFLPEGEYSLEYQLLSTTKGCNWAGVVALEEILPLVVECYQNFDLQYPRHGDTIQSLYPVFNWFPLTPARENVMYRLKIFPLAGNPGGENNFQVRTLLPLIEAKSINATGYTIDPAQNLLQYDEMYAWQVEAYAMEGTKEKTLAISDIWIFHTPRRPPGQGLVKKDIWRKIDQIDNDDIVVTPGDYLYLSHENMYQPGVTITYEIEPLDQDQQGSQNESNRKTMWTPSSIRLKGALLTDAIFVGDLIPGRLYRMVVHYQYKDNTSKRKYFLIKKHE